MSQCEAENRHPESEVVHLEKEDTGLRAFDPGDDATPSIMVAAAGKSPQKGTKLTKLFFQDFEKE